MAISLHRKMDLRSLATTQECVKTKGKIYKILLTGSLTSYIYGSPSSACATLLLFFLVY